MSQKDRARDAMDRDNRETFKAITFMLALAACLTTLVLLTGCGTMKQWCYDVSQSKRCL